MTQLVTLFLNNLLPILLAAGTGFLLSRYTRADPRTLSQVIFYVFSPCLIFKLLAHSELSNGDILRVGVVVLISVLLVGAGTWLVGMLFHVERRLLAAMMLASMFMNAGNFGLPLVLFAFGDAALGYASVFFVTNAVLSYTIGVVIASMGSANLSTALLNLVKIPAIYALALALIFMRTKWSVPLPLDRTITILGDASIPAMLVLLGMQLQGANLKGRALPLSITGLMRLVASPLILLLIAPLFGLAGAARQAVVIEAGTPTAVLTTVLATEYQAEPSFVTAAVFITTLLSPLTLTPLLALLGA